MPSWHSYLPLKKIETAPVRRHSRNKQLQAMAIQLPNPIQRPKARESKRPIVRANQRTMAIENQRPKAKANQAKGDEKPETQIQAVYGLSMICWLSPLGSIASLGSFASNRQSRGTCLGLVGWAGAHQQG